MVAAFDYCLHGRGGAAPSIDTAMHALVDADHVDHLHPDAGIAFATAADGEELTRRCFGDRVAWVPWRRPGLPARAGHGRDPARPARGDRRDPRRPRHHRLGRDLRRLRGELARDHPDRRARSSPSTGGPSRSGRWSPGSSRCPPPTGASARPRCCPVLRGLASTDRPQVGHFNDADVVLDFVSRAEHPRLAALGTSCPDHFLRTKVAPMVLDLPPTAPDRGHRRAAQGAARRLPRGVPRLLRAARDARQPGDARRRPGDRAGPRRRDVQLRRQQADRAGRRRVLRQRHQRDARRRGALDLRADRRVREVPHRVLGARGGEAGAAAEAEAARDPGRARDRRGLGHRQGDRPPAGGRGRLRGRRRHRRRQRRGGRAPSSAGRTSRSR